MMDPAAAVVAHVAAFNAGDLAGVLAGLTPDAVWITGRTTARGRAELADLFGGAITGLAPTLRIEQLIAAGDRAAAQLTETLTYTGERRTVPIAGFYRLRGGLICLAKIYREGSAELE